MELLWTTPEVSLPEPPLAMPQSLWRTLYRRGYKTSDEVSDLFAPKLRDLTPPHAIHQMEIAVKRLVEAHQNKEQVAVYADFDLDGTPGLALLKSALESFGFLPVKYYQPRRLSEGYGIHIAALEQLKSQGVDLVVTVDVGITDVEAVQAANEMGLDVIITDHHLPKEEIPDALAVVNPNKRECDSQMGHLCGTGVAFYLALAVKIALEKSGVVISRFDPKELLDCFAIGTITDMVPLINENRVLVKHGLVQLETTNRPGLRALLDQLKLGGRRLSSQDVSFMIAPKLNALSRLDGEILPIDIFLAEDMAQAQYLVARTLKSNERRVDLQKQALEEAICQHEATDESRFVWVWSKDFHQGVVGLVATKLAQKYNCPAFVGSQRDDGQIVGSSRLPADSKDNLVELLESCTEFLERHGGHAAAAGFEAKLAAAEDFRSALSVALEGRSPPAPSPVHYDADLELEDLTAEFMQWHQGLEPYGQGFESPVFRIRRARISECRTLSGDHYRFQFSPEDQHFHRVTALWFNPPKDKRNTLAKYKEGDLVDVLAEPQWNYFKGQRRLQLLIKDLVEKS